MTNENVIDSDEAQSFVKDVLELSSPKTENKEEFLRKFITAWHHHIPHQTVKSISIPPPERHRPTLSEIKEDIFGKIGGRCYHLNVGCWMILKALGFDVSLVPSDVPGAPKSCHVTIVVRDLTVKGSSHLIDVGTSYASLRAFPLDFEEQSPEYHDSFLRYRYVRKGDVVIRQHTTETDPALAQLFESCDGWLSFTYTHVNKEVDVSHFDSPMSQMYTKVMANPPFLSNIECRAFPNGRFVSIKNTTLLLESVDGSVEKSYFRSHDDIIAAFSQYFPQFPKHMLLAAMNDENIHLNFNKGNKE